MADVVSQQQGDLLRQLCEVLLAASDTFSADTTDLIRRRIPIYAALPLPEHRRTVRDQFRTLVGGLAAQREPTAEELALVRSAARLRAFHGLPVQDVLGAFHIVARRLWSAIRDAAQGTAAEDSVIDLVEPLWLWIQAMSTVVADAYADEAGARHGYEAGLRQRFLELLRTGGAGQEQADDIARTLGFDPVGSFRAACTPADIWSVQGRIDLLQRAVEDLPGKVICGLQGQLMVVVCQGPFSADLVGRIVQLGGGDTRVGVGLERHGLAGAELSISDGERALVIADHGGTSAWFEDVWLQASLVGSEDRLRPLFTTVRRVAREHPQLAETVVAFASAGFSLASAAEMLNIHANTVSYRLGQWSRLTDADPRTYAGLVRSMVAVTAGSTGDEVDNN